MSFWLISDRGACIILQTHVRMIFFFRYDMQTRVKHFVFIECWLAGIRWPYLVCAPINVKQPAAAVVGVPQPAKHHAWRQTNARTACCRSLVVMTSIHILVHAVHGCLGMLTQCCTCMHMLLIAALDTCIASLLAWVPFQAMVVHGVVVTSADNSKACRLACSHQCFELYFSSWWVRFAGVMRQINCVVLPAVGFVKDISTITSSTCLEFCSPLPPYLDIRKVAWHCHRQQTPRIWWQ